MKKNELNQIIARIKQEFKIAQDQEVAKLLGISRASLANHKTRKTIPHKEIISLCRKNGKDLDYILGSKKKANITNPEKKEKDELYYQEKCEIYKEEIMQLLRENSQLKTQLLNQQELVGTASKKAGNGKKIIG